MQKKLGGFLSFIHSFSLYYDIRQNADEITMA